MAPLVKGDKCDPAIKIQLQENPLSILQPLQNDSYKTLVTTYTSDFPLRPLNAPKPRQFGYQPAIELPKDDNHFGNSVTETHHNYDEKLPFLEPAVLSDHVRLTSIQMHSDKRMASNYQTSHQKEFPAQTVIPKKEKFVPSSETWDRILPRDLSRVNILSEQQDKFRCLVGKKEEKTEFTVRTNEINPMPATFQGDHCNRYQTTNMDTFQGKWGPSAIKAPKQYFSSVINLDPKDKTRQSMYNDEFRTFPIADRDKETSDLMKKSSLRPWSDTHCYQTSNKEDYKPQIVKAEIVKPLLPQTHSDLPLGDRDPKREADRQQYNTNRYFFTEPPASGLVRTHVNGAALRTKSNVEFVESVDWDRSTTNSNMFKLVPITEIPRRHRSQPPGAIPLDYYNGHIESSTSHSDFHQKTLVPEPNQNARLKRRAFLRSGKFRDETTQKNDFQPYDVNPRPKIGSYRRQFSSVPLGTLRISI